MFLALDAFFGGEFGRVFFGERCGDGGTGDTFWEKIREDEGALSDACEEAVEVMFLFLVESFLLKEGLEDVSINRHHAGISFRI